ncbi:MAG: cupin domain-containing protein [Anaerolineales bacterium]|nr:cupin domain-containing protein [Anaerolineales bacterium]
MKITPSKKQSDIPERTNPFLTGLEDEAISVGQRLREIRILRGLSLRALAELSGLNINTLSLIENEHTSPSVSTLQQLAQSLQVSITEFFLTDHGSKKLVHQKQGSRPSLAFKHSKMEDLAAGMPRFGAEPIIVTLEPGADSGKKPIVHTGREFVYCLEGQIAYTVDNEKYLLEEGDSLIFEAYLPHQWKNTDPTPSQVLLVLCPMDERDQPREQHFTR